MLNEDFKTKLIKKREQLKSKLPNDKPRLLLKSWKALGIITLSRLVLDISLPFGLVGYGYFSYYAVKKVIMPAIRNIELKFINALLNDNKKKSNLINRFNNLKCKTNSFIKKIKGKFNFAKKKDVESKEKNVEAKSKLSNDNKVDLKGKIKDISHMVSNLFVNKKDKFKNRMTLKRSILGSKIIVGEYRLKSNKIIQDKINLTEIKRFREYAAAQKEKVKVK